MKALTVCQPYAELIACGEKVIENRNWPTSYRGPLVIHAGKSLAWLDEPSDKDRFVFGAVVAVADLTDCRRLADLPVHLQDNEHANGPWCWLLANVRRVEPVPYRGVQGLFDVPSELIREESK